MKTHQTNKTVQNSIDIKHQSEWWVDLTVREFWARYYSFTEAEFEKIKVDPEHQWWMELKHQEFCETYDSCTEEEFQKKKMEAYIIYAIRKRLKILR